MAANIDPNVLNSKISIRDLCNHINKYGDEGVLDLQAKGFDLNKVSIVSGNWRTTPLNFARGTRKYSIAAECLSRLKDIKPPTSLESKQNLERKMDRSLLPLQLESETIYNIVKEYGSSCIEPLKKLGVDLNAADEQGWTPLTYAINAGITQNNEMNRVVKCLLEAGKVEVNWVVPWQQRFTDIRTPFYYACRLPVEKQVSPIPIIELLLQHTAKDEDSMSQAFKTILHEAAERNVIDAIKFVLSLNEGRKYIYALDIITPPLLRTKSKEAFNLLMQADSKFFSSATALFLSAPTKDTLNELFDLGFGISLVPELANNTFYRAPGQTKFEPFGHQPFRSLIADWDSPFYTATSREAFGLIYATDMDVAKFGAYSKHAASLGLTDLAEQLNKLAQQSKMLLKKRLKELSFLDPTVRYCGLSRTTKAEVNERFTAARGPAQEICLQIERDGKPNFNAYPNVFDHRIRGKYELDTVDATGWSPFTYALTNRMPKAAKYCLEHNMVTVTQKPPHGLSALHYACYLDSPWFTTDGYHLYIKEIEDVFKLLFAKGAKEFLEEEGEMFPRPLSLAFFNMSEITARILIQNGADVNAIDKPGRAALHWAVNRELPEIVKLILSQKDGKKHLNTLDKKGLTPFFHTTNEEILALLIEAGMDVNKANSAGLTPLQHAEKIGSEKIKQLLLARGAKNQASDAPKEEKLLSEQTTNAAKPQPKPLERVEPLETKAARDKGKPKNVIFSMANKTQAKAGSKDANAEIADEPQVETERPKTGTPQTEKPKTEKPKEKPKDSQQQTTQPTKDQKPGTGPKAGSHPETESHTDTQSQPKSESGPDDEDSDAGQSTRFLW